MGQVTFFPHGNEKEIKVFSLYYIAMLSPQVHNGSTQNLVFLDKKSPPKPDEL